MQFLPPVQVFSVDPTHVRAVAGLRTAVAGSVLLATRDDLRISDAASEHVLYRQLHDPGGTRRW